MPNLLLWAPDSTLDHDFRFDAKVSEVARRLLTRKDGYEQLLGCLQPKPKEAPETTLQAMLETIRDGGLSADSRYDLTVKNVPKHPTAGAGDAVACACKGGPHHLRRVMESIDRWLLAQYPDVGEAEHIGGNPAISALRGAYLRLSKGTTLPKVYYVGLLPEHVRAALVDEHKEVMAHGVFDFAKPLPEMKPRTLGFETPKAKFMLIYREGRDWTDLLPNDVAINEMLRHIGDLIKRENPARIVLGVNVPRDKRQQEKASALIERARDKFGREQLKVFMATSGFKKPEEAAEVIGFLQLADIVSANDSEIDKLHTAQMGPAGHQEIPLARKLRQLKFNAIKVCHGPYGVALDLGTRPEDIVTSSSFAEDPALFLQTALRRAADGATYAMDQMAHLGRTATDAMIQVYSSQVPDDGRQDARFRATFLSVDERPPAGMVMVPSAYVAETLGAVVGAGAMFDGLFLSYLMRDD